MSVFRYPDWPVPDWAAMGRRRQELELWLQRQRVEEAIDRAKVIHFVPYDRSLPSEVHVTLDSHVEPEDLIAIEYALGL